MALTDVRRLFLIAIACVLVWIGVIYRPIGSGLLPKRRQPPPTNPVTVAAGQLAAANDRWRLLELRDSIVSLVPKGAGTEATILLDESLPEELRTRLATTISSQWRALVPAPLIPVAIAIVVDTVKSPHGHARPFHFVASIPIETFLPSSQTGGVCISLAHLASPPQGRMGKIVMQNLITSETIASLLNPCALLAAFGAPSPRISEWLRDGGWGVARFAEWNTTPSPWNEVVRAGSQGNRPVGGWLDGLGDPTWHIRGYVATPGIACLAGESGACSRILIGLRRTTPDSIWLSSVTSSSGTNAFAFFLPNGAAPLGPAAGWVVSEMVRTLGRERFARFWHSSLPVDSAFRDAAGQTLDDWVRVWGRRMYGPAAVGPTVSGVGLLTGAIIVILTLAASIAVERRRRVA